MSESHPNARPTRLPRPGSAPVAVVEQLDALERIQQAFERWERTDFRTPAAREREARYEAIMLASTHATLWRKVADDYGETANRREEALLRVIGTTLTRAGEPEIWRVIYCAFEHLGGVEYELGDELRFLLEENQQCPGS